MQEQLTALRAANLQELSGELARLGASLCQRRDVLLAASGFKASRLLLTDCGIDALDHLSREFKFSFAVGDQRFELCSDPRKGGFSNLMQIGAAGDGRRVVFIAQDNMLPALLLRHSEDHEFIAQALRIPKCCATFYVAYADAAAKRDFDYTRFTKMPPSLSAPLLCNTVSRYFDRGVVDHFPCRHDCPETLAVAKGAAEILRGIDRDLTLDLVVEGTFIFSDTEGVFWLEPLPNGTGTCVVHARTTDSTDLARHLNLGARLTLTQVDDELILVVQQPRGDCATPVDAAFRNISAVTFTWRQDDCGLLPELDPSVGSVPVSSKLRGRLAMVTGSQGLCLAFADALVRSGAGVILCSRSETHLALARTELLRAAPTAPVTTVNLDVRDTQSCRSVFADFEKDGLRPDILIHCAGTSHPNDVRGISDTQWNDLVAIMMTGPRILTQEFIGHSDRGVIVFVGSSAALCGEPGQAAYCAAKAGARGYAMALASECQQKQLPYRVVSLNPSGLETNWRREPSHGRGSVRDVCSWLVDALQQENAPMWLEGSF